MREMRETNDTEGDTESSWNRRRTVDTGEGEMRKRYMNSKRVDARGEE